MTNFNFFSLEMKVGQESVLLIMINSDGTIKRRGDGTDKTDSPYAMGMIDASTIFKQLNPSVMACKEYFNVRFDDPEKKGRPITLEVQLLSEELSTGFTFTYGSKSAWPPKEILELVEKAILLTNSWYAASTRQQ